METISNSSFQRPVESSEDAGMEFQAAIVPRILKPDKPGFHRVSTEEHLAAVCCSEADMDITFYCPLKEQDTASEAIDMKRLRILGSRHGSPVPRSQPCAADLRRRSMDSVQQARSQDLGWSLLPRANSIIGGSVPCEGDTVGSSMQCRNEGAEEAQSRDCGCFQMTNDAFVQENWTSHSMRHRKTQSPPFC